MKKRILLLATVAVLAAIAVGGTVAYFTGADQVHNVITTGSVDIELIEKTIDQGGAVVDFPEEGVKDVLPGTAVSKIVSVRNDGEATAWIRISVEQAIRNAAGEPLPLELEADGETIPVMTVRVDDEKWICHDGFYYYVEPVEPGAHTTTLFEEVFFAEQMGDEYQDCTANIIVSAQAVQTANNPIPAGGNVTDVKGWPEG